MTTRKRQSTSAATMRQLQEQTLQEGLVFVRARKIVEALWTNGERYHAGAIEHAEWAARNVTLWQSAERDEIDNEVKAQLRRQR